jgi:hypothetical protein
MTCIGDVFVMRFLCRPFHGLEVHVRFITGVPLRSTPGFMLAPAPRAKKI